MYYSSDRIIKNKVGLLNLAEELGNISQACKVMGFTVSQALPLYDMMAVYLNGGQG